MLNPEDGGVTFLRNVDFQRTARCYSPEDEDLDPRGEVKVKLPLLLSIKRYVMKTYEGV
jgi:hypothetical protein